MEDETKNFLISFIEPVFDCFGFLKYETYFDVEFQVYVHPAQRPICLCTENIEKAQELANFFFEAFEQKNAIIVHELPSLDLSKNLDDIYYNDPVVRFFIEPRKQNGETL